MVGTAIEYFRKKKVGELCVDSLVCKCRGEMPQEKNNCNRSPICKFCSEIAAWVGNI